MKFSRYNIEIDIDGNRMLMNTVSLDLLPIDSDFPLCQNGIDSAKLSSEQISMLQEGGFIVDDALDELQVIEDKFDAEKTESLMSVKLLLSTECNSNCQYCYQHFANYENSTISDAQIRTFVLWVNNYVVENNIQKFSLELFGGEPLLASKHLPLLFDLLNELKSNRLFSEFSVSIITNTSLFTDQILSLLVKNDVEFKFSIDGPKNVHDNRRPLKNGTSSYDKTIEAIKKIKEMGRIDLVTARFNLDKGNIECLENVAQSLHELGVERLYCGRVFFRGKSTPYSTNIINEKSYYQNGMCLKIFHVLSKYGYSDTPCVIEPSRVCQFYRLHSYVVSPKLEVAKCDELLDIKEQRVGYIDSSGSLKKIGENYQLQTGKTPSKDTECKNCAYLPICGMGCPIEAMNLTGSPLNHVCMNKEQLQEKIKILLMVNNE